MANVTLARPEFTSRIHQLFQQWRKERFEPATMHWFLTAPLFQSAQLSAPDGSITPPATLIKLCLTWVVELLRPRHDTPADPKRVRDFTILSAYYRDGEGAKTVYRALGGTESTFRTNWCKEATAAAADLLYTHWHATTDSDMGRLWQMYAQSHQLAPGVQSVLQLLAVSREPWSPLWLTTLAQQLVIQGQTTAADAGEIEATLTKTAATLHDLPVQAALGCFVTLGWLQATVCETGLAETAPIEFGSVLRTQLCNSLTQEEVQQGHRLAAHCAYLAQAPLTAIWHWQQAGEYSCAAQMLLQTGQAFFAMAEDQEEAPLADDVTATLARLLNKLPAQAVTVALWGRLKRLSGRIAQLQATQSHRAPTSTRAALIQRAMSDYQEALRCLTDSVEKAAVHYQLADLALPLDSALADQHLRQCIDLLTSAPANQALIGRAYIKRAWLSIQQRPDLVAAEANLKQARRLLEVASTADPNVWSDWYNAWGTLSFCKGEFAKGVEALAQGIELLREQPNQVRLCMMLHNQGLEFSTQPGGEQKIALHYLQQSLAIAIRIQHVQMQMLCYKAIGGCYFHLCQYEEALRFYEEAYALIPADSDFKVHLCYDLAEAHVMRTAPAAAITYFRQGLALAQQMDLQEMIAAYHELAAGAPWLWIETYKPRMEAAIRLLVTQGQFKSQEYAQAANINEKTALKDLQEWVAQKILCQTGKARATVYVLSHMTG